MKLQLTLMLLAAAAVAIAGWFVLATWLSLGHYIQTVVR